MSHMSLERPLIIFFILLMVQVQKSQTTTWDAETPVNNGINHQPQLVKPRWLPSKGLVKV